MGFLGTEKIRVLRLQGEALDFYREFFGDTDGTVRLAEDEYRIVKEAVSSYLAEVGAQ